MSLPTNAVTLYGTITDLQNRLSDAGVNLRVDDKPLVADAVMRRASARIDQFCRGRYDMAQLALSAWVLESWTTLAAYYLARRRGNAPPAVLVEDYEELERDLLLVKKGWQNIEDIPERKPGVPVISNQHVRLGPAGLITVVEPQRSTGTPSGYGQFRDIYEIVDYQI